ncbi:ubiquitin-conjugating enzyme E2-binding protein [Hypoxylon trugodes]|uniref:ubiquitin-conjugating enzyme E2-binding protein n=1 Tax=Hypoxylon trugodes TaxID=326681 RepID=UPI0021A0BA89|nr:ubiquitin-conjugating enzyme E2-binding protein [Hypoxylon trugodes]KAI1386211.1 ubiquitin-conjugating enzyme E2-binding protein [Hypoxylon trugodes]
MSVPHPVIIYAELLSNIKQVSVGCSLSTPISPDTRATVSSDGLVLTVNHDGLERSLRLPERVAVNKQLPIPNLKAQSLSWRLPLATALNRPIIPITEEQNVPWSANDLQPESPVTCRTCHTTIVQSGTIKVWKDLPSENWAEMMEFWHCHKPHDHSHGHEDDNLTSKGYGASSKISAQTNVGFVDLTSFLLSSTDISTSAITKIVSSDLKSESEEHEIVSKNGESAQTDDRPIFCSSCKNQLGVLNDQEASISLFKWQIQVDEQAQGITTPPRLSHCISAMLLATMARSGCSKSIILPMKSQDQPVKDDSEANGLTKPLLNIWVFNNNITFSSTEEANSPVQAVKVFYRMVSQSQADTLLDSMTSDVQDITLPTDAIEKVIDILRSSNQLLPQGGRKLGEWTIGLVEKWNGKGR